MARFIKERTLFSIMSMLFVWSCSSAAFADCGLYGAVYKPHPQPSLHNVDQPAVYRLIIQKAPPSAPDAAFADNWVFQMYDPNGKKLITDLSMEESCPNGRGLCNVSVLGDPDSVQSDVVELGQNFSLFTKSDEAPYAIILPGFVSANWIFLDPGPMATQMHFLTSPHLYPDLSAAVSWVRVSCGKN